MWLELLAYLFFIVILKISGDLIGIKPVGNAGK